ncbi:MAG TPA: hypothetical protein PL196_00590 [Burkholderiaceae bacterium]|nr:hypothetical protein [Burkholderiaceae bacterium]
MLEHHLADELVLIVSPDLLGTGKRLFAEGTPARSFALVDALPMPSGVRLNSNHSAGPVNAARVRQPAALAPRNRRASSTQYAAPTAMLSSLKS